MYMAVYVHTKDHTGLSGSKKFGFTLAEVLIITVILGVIAFLTIPALVTNIQDMQTRTRLKKAYQILSAATILVVNENGGTLTGLPKIGWIGNSLISYYYKYLNVAKQCTHANTRGNCWHAENVAHYLDGTPASEATWEYIGIGLIL